MSEGMSVQLLHRTILLTGDFNAHEWGDEDLVIIELLYLKSETFLYLNILDELF